MQNEMLDVRSVDIRTANKEHTCKFSGKTIRKGHSYYAIVYTKGTDQHYTYHLAIDEFPQFVREKLFMSPGLDFVEMEEDVSNLKQQAAYLLTKYEDVPGFKRKLERAMNPAS